MYRKTQNLRLELDLTRRANNRLSHEREMLVRLAESQVRGLESGDAPSEPAEAHVSQDSSLSSGAPVPHELAARLHAELAQSMRAELEQELRSQLQVQMSAEMQAEVSQVRAQA